MKNNNYKELFQEEASSFNEIHNLSVYSLKIDSEKKDGVLFFIPQIGMSYKSYIGYFKQILINENIGEVVSFDHYGSGISAGSRGENATTEHYLKDCKNVYKKYINQNKKIIVFGHGFGATLSLLAEGEGVFKSAVGLIVKDPFLMKSDRKKIISQIGYFISSKKIKSNISLEVYLGNKFFPEVKDQLLFEYSCINARSFRVDFLETLRKMSSSVVERAYLTDKPILFLHDKNTSRTNELFELYQKGVGESKVTNLELTKEGYFQNFTLPEERDIRKIHRWIDGIPEEQV